MLYNYLITKRIFTLTMNRIQIIRASIIMRKVVTYTIWIAHKHNVTQLLGCVPWEHVSHEHTSPSITVASRLSTHPFEYASQLSTRFLAKNLGFKIY